MKHGSLFSGIGGFDLAAEWAGWENMFHCEWNPFGQKVLKHYWPNAATYEDITKTDFTIWRGRIDILTGGFPCQPYSAAGKRLGKEDERHLWPEMLRVIREVQPRWVVGENVLGLVNWNGGLVFDEVQADLEAEGYEVQPFILPAASVNAPHKRDRVWFVAYSDHKGRSCGFGQIQETNGEIPKRDNNAEPCNTGSGNAPDTTGFGGRGIQGRKWTNETIGNQCNGNHGLTPDTDHNGYATAENGQGLGEGNDRNKTGQNDAIEFEGRAVSDGVAENTLCSGRIQREPEQEGAEIREQRNACSGDSIGVCGEKVAGPTTDTDNVRLQQCKTPGTLGEGQEEICGEGHKPSMRTETNECFGVAPDTDNARQQAFNKKITELGEKDRAKTFSGNGFESLHTGSWWKSFPTQSPICSRTNGFQTRLDSITFSKWRNESIKAAGNAIVPQVVFQIFKAINEYREKYP